MLSAREAGDRYWAKVRMGDCWEWPSEGGAVWGRPFGLGERLVSPQRVAVLLTRGDPGDVRLHRSCRNARCVRPEHLYTPVMPVRKKRLPLTKEGFWQRVDMDGEGCWEWLAGRRGEYGIISGRPFGFPQPQVGAHVVAFTLAHGRKPRGIVRHTCDNPPCVRPEHLEEGQPIDNLWDAMRRGRHPRFGIGEQHPEAKLTEEKVRELWALRAAGWGKQRLAKRYGVSDKSIRNILRGETWVHVPHD